MQPSFCKHHAGDAAGLFSEPVSSSRSFSLAMALSMWSQKGVSGWRPVHKENIPRKDITKQLTTIGQSTLLGCLLRFISCHMHGLGSMGMLMTWPREPTQHCAVYQPLVNPVLSAQLTKDNHPSFVRSSTNI